MWPCIVTDFFIINWLDVLISQIYFGRKLHISDSSSVHHQEFFTVHTAVVYVIQVCWQLVNCQQTCITYTIAVCTVKNSWWWTEEPSETCRVSFQNKFEKLVHLVGFIIKKFFSPLYFILTLLVNLLSEFDVFTCHALLLIVVGMMPMHFMPYNSSAPALQTCIVYLDLPLHSYTVTENCAKIKYLPVNIMARTS